MLEQSLNNLNAIPDSTSKQELLLIYVSLVMLTVLELVLLLVPENVTEPLELLMPNATTKNLLKIPITLAQLIVEHLPLLAKMLPLELLPQVSLKLV